MVRRRVDRLVGGVVGDLVEERAEARQRTGQRPCGELESRLAVGAKVVDPGGHGRDGCRPEGLLRGVDIAFGDAHDLEGSLRSLIGGPRTEAGLGEQARHVVQHLATVDGILGKAVHDHDERQAPLSDATEHQPRDTIRVAGRRRHEQAQVGRFHQLVGEVAVGVLDAVDVRGVDECKSRGDAPVLLDPEPARFDPGERATSEGQRVVGVGEDDGRPGRRPEDARRAGRATRDRVEERALPSPRRPEQQHDQGRIEAAGADPDMASKVIAQPHRAGASGIRRRTQRRAPAGELLEPVDEFFEASGLNPRIGRLSLGAVIHRHRVTPARPTGTAEDRPALSVPLQTMALDSQVI